MEATLGSILLQTLSQGPEGLETAEQQIDLLQEVHRTHMTPVGISNIPFNLRRVSANSLIKFTY